MATIHEQTIPDGGIAPQTALTAKRYVIARTGGYVPPVLTSGADTACDNGSIFYAELWVPTRTVVTGIGYLIGSVGGTDKVVGALYGSTGLLLANTATAGTTVGTAATVQEVDLTAVYTINGPGLFYLALQFNGSTAKFRSIVANGTRGTSQAGTFGTMATLTTPVVAGTAADKSPTAYLY